MQYTFDIEIPDFLIIDKNKKNDSVNFDLLNNKAIVGLCGYSKSGKDYIASKLAKDYGFYRIALADNAKKDMNQYMKDLIFENINFLTSPKYPNYIALKDIDFTTENLVIKKILRPYIIWYAETIRELNGPYYWINRAFEFDANCYDKIVMSDIRRPKELEIFEDSNYFKKKTREGFINSGYLSESYKDKSKTYESLLFYVNQYGLDDEDPLTKETILTAQKNWLFDDTFYVDSRLPENGSFREKSINFQIKNISKKFGINSKDKTISNRQIKMF